MPPPSLNHGEQGPGRGCRRGTCVNVEGGEEQEEASARGDGAPRAARQPIPPHALHRWRRGQPVIRRQGLLPRRGPSWTTAGSRSRPHGSTLPRSSLTSSISMGFGSSMYRSRFVVISEITDELDETPHVAAAQLKDVKHKHEKKRRILSE